jgi:hypothetical protein
VWEKQAFELLCKTWGSVHFIDKAGNLHSQETSTHGTVVYCLFNLICMARLTNEGAQAKGLTFKQAVVSLPVGVLISEQVVQPTHALACNVCACQKVQRV